MVLQEWLLHQSGVNSEEVYIGGHFGAGAGPPLHDNSNNISSYSNNLASSDTNANMCVGVNPTDGSWVKLACTLHRQAVCVAGESAL